MPVTASHVVDALASLGGEAHWTEIARRVREIAPPPLPAKVGAVVRARIQERCAEASSFRKGAPNLFESVHGVDARRGYWRLRKDTLASTNPDRVLDGADAFIEEEEGRAELRIHLRRERSRKLIREFKATLENFKCTACEFDFGNYYGAAGYGYIEAHHIVPVASLSEGDKTSIKDLVALCANCHRIIHWRGLITVQELKRKIAEMRE